MKGKIEDYLPHIKQRLSLRYSQVDSISSASAAMSQELAEKQSSKYDVIISCGGDGTLHNVINGVMRSEANPIVGILPFGTCNDVARSLNIPLDLEKAIDCLLRLDVTKYDCLTDKSKFITYSIATGYLTKATYSTSGKAKRKLGRFAYVISAIKNLFNFNAIPMTVTFDKERIHGKFVFMMLLNGNYAGGMRLNKNDNYSDGKVKLVLIKKTRGLGAFFTFVKLFMFGLKSIKKSKCAVVEDVSSVEIENHSNSPFVVDGEKEKFLKKRLTVKTGLTFIKR